MALLKFDGLLVAVLMIVWACKKQSISVWLSVGADRAPRKGSWLCYRCAVVSGLVPLVVPSQPGDTPSLLPRKQNHSKFNTSPEKK